MKPRYPNGSSTWNVKQTWINCTTATKKACLFNIIDDPTEHRDLAAQLPDVVDRMVARMHELQESVYDPDRGVPEVDEACVAVTQYGGYWGPWRK